MKFNVATDYKTVSGEIILVGLFEKTRSLCGAAAVWDSALNGMIHRLISRGEVTGILNQTVPVVTDRHPGLRVLLVGLGKQEDVTLDRLRGACAAGARAVRERNGDRIGLPVDFIEHPAFPLPEKIRAYVEGVRLGLYRFRQFKTCHHDNSGHDPDVCTIYVGDLRHRLAVHTEVAKASSIADAVCLARDLVNMPANAATPSYLAAQARTLAKRWGLRCTVITPRGARQLGMNAFLSVARGSDEPPRFIVLEYRPRTMCRHRPIVLIGKAVTFDSGGISLKPSQDMDEMKTDMAGGAAVLATVQASAALKLPLHIVGIIPAAENLPSGHALKPGDVVTTMAGITVEIITTDAEGRLMLADALTYAQRYKPAALIDIATLTGGCIVALGNHATGLMGTDRALLHKIQQSADATGERVWELPLWQEYGELLKSDVADIKNAAGRPAGAITAGCFLKQFAGTTPWAHLDIAGTAWTKKALPYIPKGATGIGVRLLTHVLEHWDNK
ncbi:MAG: leucyl aminopeptidase [Desulfobacterota bacterium]|nr:leucyl aminopeptidase [Thermodesulfobacteriota bacterium]